MREEKAIQLFNILHQAWKNKQSYEKGASSKLPGNHGAPRLGRAFLHPIKHFVSSAAGKMMKREGMHREFSEFVSCFLLVGGKKSTKNWPGHLGSPSEGDQKAPGFADGVWGRRKQEGRLVFINCSY